MTKKDWIAAAFVLLTFTFFGLAFFLAPRMTGGQLIILRFLASASAGFAGLLFAGKASFNGEGMLPIVGKVTLVGTASFALFFVVWFSFGQVANDLGGLDQSFSITVRVFDEHDQPVTAGDLTLHIGQDTRPAQVLSNGEANFKEIPSVFRGDSSRVVANIPGFELTRPHKIVLSPDEVSELKLTRVEEPLPPIYTTVGTSLWQATFQRNDANSSRHYLEVNCGSETVRTDRFFKGTYFLSPKTSSTPVLGTAPERRDFFDQLHMYLSEAEGENGSDESNSGVDRALTRWTQQDTTIVCDGLARGSLVEIELRLRQSSGPDSLLARARTTVTGRHPAQGIILEITQ